MSKLGRSGIDGQEVLVTYCSACADKFKGKG